MYVYSLIRIFHIYEQIFLAVDQRGSDNRGCTVYAAPSPLSYLLLSLSLLFSFLLFFFWGGGGGGKLPPTPPSRWNPALEWIKEYTYVSGSTDHIKSIVALAKTLKTNNILNPLWRTMHGSGATAKKWAYAALLYGILHVKKDIHV